MIIWRILASAEGEWHDKNQYELLAESQDLQDQECHRRVWIKEQRHSLDEIWVNRVKDLQIVLQDKYCRQ